MILDLLDEVKVLMLWGNVGEEDRLSGEPGLRTGTVNLNEQHHSHWVGDKTPDIHPMSGGDVSEQDPAINCCYVEHHK